MTILAIPEWQMTPRHSSLKEWIFIMSHTFGRLRIRELLSWGSGWDLLWGYSHLGLQFLKTWLGLEIPLPRSLMWLLIGGFNSSPCRHHPKAVQDMVSPEQVLRNTERVWKQSKQKLGLLWPKMMWALGSDSPSFLPYSIGYTDQSWSMWEGVRQRCEYQEVGFTEAIVQTGYQNDIMTINRLKTPHNQILDLWG